MISVCQLGSQQRFPDHIIHEGVHIIGENVYFPKQKKMFSSVNAETHLKTHWNQEKAKRHQRVAWGKMGHFFRFSFRSSACYHLHDLYHHLHLYHHEKKMLPWLFSCQSNSVGTDLLSLVPTVMDANTLAPTNSVECQLPYTRPLKCPQKSF